MPAQILDPARARLDFGPSPSQLYGLDHSRPYTVTFVVPLYPISLPKMQ